MRQLPSRERDFLPGQLNCSANVFGMPICSGTPRGPRLDSPEVAEPLKIYRNGGQVGRVALKATTCCGAPVLGVPRGPGSSLLKTDFLNNCSRSGTVGMDIRSKMLMDVPLDGVSQETGQGNRHTGELLVAESRGPRAGRDRESVRVRVLGDGAFGWTEAVNVWGATVEVVVHIIANNHRISALFDLPKSYGCATAARRFWKGESDGLFLSTIHAVEEAGVAGKLFNLWQPRFAILALTSSLTTALSLEST